MRNIFLFIRIYFNFLFFLFLMGISLFMLFNYNRYQHTVYSATAGEITGRISKQYNDVEYYFQLKKTNDSLVKANAVLYNKLKQDYEMPDTVSKLAVDTIQIDTILHQRKYLYLPAKVVGNSVSQPNNYLQIHRGSLQGVSADLGVTDINNYVVGTVVDVSKNYSVVMSLLHRQSNISAKLKKTGETGSVIWDGVKPNVVILKDISKEVKVAKGDSVITSGFSDKFPLGLLIGTVTEIVNDKTSSTYTIKVKTAANFYNLQYVNIINNLQKDEPKQLLKSVKKINE
ncbi:rod shape-determining protein MreC [Ginsengibacter hankyongi]|uniref:Cell shape-determining protein MreC n=1 Tax=Ginsengibacter hankyongi TaxID=2607284 RepID=A0A5J5IL32_9BACT|nr:rod shape-determining protein MreC [Ginsengibacter hankyongi]KAA9041815.1 rod shape-determining protein MreC [Ginsengibacter hankyongi]